MTNPGGVTAVPMTYAGVRFRSTLEADWAATLDSLGIVWQYEPEAVRLPSGDLYRPDFYLPKIATWLEVKGPLGERLDKTIALAEAVCHFPGCFDDRCNGGCSWDSYQMVVVGLAPVSGEVSSYLIDICGGFCEDGALRKCPNCGAWWWCGGGAYGCRAHRRGQCGDDDLGGSDTPPRFVRADKS